MKAITIRQPWANLIACSLKIIETRHWKTFYRGPLAIHASKNPDTEAFEYLKKTDFEELFSCELSLEPRGVIIAVSLLTEIMEFNNKLHFAEYLFEHLVPYGFAKYGWWLDHKKTKKFKTPIPWRGMPGLFNINSELLP